MNLWIILAIVAVICLLNRGPREERRSPRHRRRRNSKYESHYDTDERFDRLNARITTLEEILLDRERRLRDQFRGL
ncbi:MAG: hypothetical protein AAF950_05820 [Pseudomonadota bacterium]